MQCHKESTQQGKANVHVLNKDFCSWLALITVYHMCVSLLNKIVSPNSKTWGGRQVKAQKSSFNNKAEVQTQNPKTQNANSNSSQRKAGKKKVQKPKGRRRFENLKSTKTEKSTDQRSTGNTSKNTRNTRNTKNTGDTGLVCGNRHRRLIRHRCNECAN